MPHTFVKIDARRITGWGTFHDLFTELLGFPASYPRNMSAWMRALAELDNPAAALTSVQVEPGGMLVLQIEEVDDFAQHFPQQYAALLECTSIVNWRRIEAGKSPILVLSFFKN